MNNNILSALNALPVAKLDRSQWIAVGMALKHEGYPVSVWDSWSRKDDRYKPGECEQKWKGFGPCAKPVTGGTIIQMAKAWGWSPWNCQEPLMWDGEIFYDGVESSAAPDSGRSPSEDLILYLQTLFDPDDYVSYVTGEVWQNGDGRWVPRRGVFSRTARELVDSLKRYPDDLGAAVGDWKEEAGAWIRFNPMDGQGIKNENVKAFRYALVECDSIPMSEQLRLYTKMELPIAALVSSGGKSLHAIVRVDAKDAEEYRERVDFLYNYLEKSGVPVDRQNKNPSRLSRMPGVTRNGRRQRLLDVNIGQKSWADWIDWIETREDGLPPIVSLSDFEESPPPLPEEMIRGILRCGHKMLVSGPSKAGKSFLLMELCIAFAEGRKWLGFPCRQGKVLYINLEIDPASAIHRFLNIYETLDIPMTHAGDILIWNLRGNAIPLDRLVPMIIRRVRNRGFSAIVLDPIYKVITGDENSASEMGYFCNQIDKICSETGCSMIYCHHHSKGAQGEKKAMDRASGSGVFARDPDAQLDIIGLQMTEDIENNVRDGDATPWRLETSLREFPKARQVEFWFEYPIHWVDENEVLKALPAEGSFAAGRLKNRRARTAEECAEEFRNAFDALSLDGKTVPLRSMAEYLECSERTVYDRASKIQEEFRVRDKVVFRYDPSAELPPETKEDIPEESGKKPAERLLKRKSSAKPKSIEK